MPGLCKLLPAALQRLLISNPEDTALTPVMPKGSTHYPGCTGNQTWALLCSRNYNEETFKSNDYCLTLEDNLQGRGNALSVFWRTSLPPSSPTLLLPAFSHPHPQPKHVELFIRWVPPYIIKGKMRTSEIQSLGDNIASGNLTGFRIHAHGPSLQGAGVRTRSEC